ncbi:cytochrome C biogenesis protein CcmA [Legionella norrlandica]|uniref:Cytochrome C biogenesis protein CcmA n=1 Tax=Legionella norrlandica TaxID=1498499 RepID=A0A0A2SPX1_9GAMM|nr:heme ABC exporter ATP-binding protein CcmA [Legionella norrlandica]KGP63195.1 cytochrome C biogenesis protein CcmA [Legionella norrlandica]
MLDVIELDFDYYDQPLLRKISLHLLAGDLLHLKGANGAGKTTLLKLISGLLKPEKGEIHFEGESIHKDLASYQKKICFVGHKSGINPFLTLKENCFFDVHFPADGLSIVSLCSLFHLEHHLDYPCGLLSSGQKRQVALLRLWMTQAKLWLLDEPLVALDAFALATLMSKIKEHRARGGAVLLTSHQDLPLSKADYGEYYL